jgi:hypothetical protein
VLWPHPENTVPVVIFGAAVRRIVVRQLAGKPVAIQLAAHLLLCAAFCDATAD